jgi:non-ribosomal peptide synthase protein (TIGR01720 family)
MLPSSVVELPTLPLTPNGKVDRKALTVMDLAPITQNAGGELADTPLQELLVSIWKEVLHLPQVSIYDNFFALGGDSILSMQVIARARLAGWHLTPKQLFQHQTIAQLATVAEPLGKAHPSEQAQEAEGTGAVPLTPIQHWFFAQDLPQPQHFNQAVLLQVPSSWNQRHLRQVVNAWLLRHAALRLRYERTETGWQQQLVSDTEAGTVTVERRDLTQIAPTEQQSRIEEVASSVQASLDLQHGPLLRLVLFELGNEQASRLLIAIHHLAVDGVSWRILLSEMQVAMNQLSLGEPIVLPATSASFQRWAEQVHQLAQSTLVQKERAYWLRAAQVPTVSLPVGQAHRLHDCRSERCNTGASARTVSMALTSEETRLLLQDALRPYRSHIQELLLVAVLQTLGRWMGTQTIRLDLEGHGREELLADPLDVSQTVGWFTSLYPVLFTLPQDGEGQRLGLAPDSASTWIKTMKEQLRTVPHKGIGYGLLRYLHAHPELREQLAPVSPAQVSFNYLGQFDQVGVGSKAGSPALQPAPESSGQTFGPANPRSHLLEVNALVITGQLYLQWTYSEQLHHRTTIESLATETMHALRMLLTHCLTPGAGGLTPSDFPLTRLDQASLDRLLAGRRHRSGASSHEREDIYPHD